MKSQNQVSLGAMLALLVALSVVVGCRFSSSDSVSRGVDIRVAGLYRGDNGLLVSQNTGDPITQLNVIQDGSRLQAIDNNGMIFRGNVGSVSPGEEGGARSATFQLNGPTTTGEEGVISGTIITAGTTATMNGTWAEPTLFGSVRGRADNIEPPPDPDPDPDPDPENNG